MRKMAWNKKKRSIKTNKSKDQKYATIWMSRKPSTCVVFKAQIK